MVDDRRIIHEITPLMGKDVLYIADRHKKEFTYPIHNHSVYELNFVENAKGVRRIVGDSQEVIGDYDLCLITSPDLEHVWEQNECHSDDIREITIQFDFSMGDETLFGRNPYASITRMMQEAKKGLSFPDAGHHEGIRTARYFKYRERWFLCRTAVPDHSLRTVTLRKCPHPGFQQLCQGNGRRR